MQKTPIFYFLAALMLIVTALSATAAPFDLDILEPSLVVVGNHSTVVSGTFTVGNTGDNDLVLVTLGKTDLNGVDGINNISSGQVTFTPSSFYLANNSNRTVNYYISIPATQLAQTYLGGFEAKYIANTSVNDLVPVSLTVQPQYDFSISSTTPTIVQGATDKLKVTVTNTGNTPLSNIIYQLGSTFKSGGTDLSYVEASAGVISLANGESKDLDFTFNVPASQAVGAYSAYINMTSLQGPVNKGKTLNVNVEAENRQITISTTQDGKLVFRRDTGSELSASHKDFMFRINNTGNVDISNVAITKADLVSGSDTLSSSKLALSANNFALSTGASQDVTVSTAGLNNETSGTYTGLFTIDYGNSQTTTVAVQFVVSDATAAVSFPGVTLPEGPRGSIQNSTLVVNNSGDYPLTNIQVTASGANNITLSNIPNSLAVGASANIGITAFVPQYQDAGISKLATLNFVSSEVSASSDLNSQVATKLKITKVKLTLAGNSQTITEDGKTASNKLKPLDTFALEVTVKNLYTNSEDVRIEDVLVDATFFEIDENQDDIDGESEYFDLDPEEDLKKTVDFDSNEVGFDVDEGTYKLEITVEGDDELGATHDDKWTIYVKVDRENKVDPHFTDVSLSPSTVSCLRTSYLTVQGTNLGTKKDDKNKLIIESSNLGLNKEYDFDIGRYNDDDCDAVGNPSDGCAGIDHTESITVPANIAAGTYPIHVKWYYKNTQLGDDQTVNLHVEACGTSTTATSTGGTATGTTGTTGTTALDTTGSTASDLDVQFAGGDSSGLTPRGQVYASQPTRLTDTTEKGFRDSTAYLFLLGLGSLIALLLIVSILGSLFRGPKPTKVERRYKDDKHDGYRNSKEN